MKSYVGWDSMGQRLTGVADPTAATDGATRKYVDDQLAPLLYHTFIRAQRTADQNVVSRTPTTAWTDCTWDSALGYNRGNGILSYVNANNSIKNISGRPIGVNLWASVGFDANTSGARWMTFQRRRPSTSATLNFYPHASQTGAGGMHMLRSQGQMYLDPDDEVVVMFAQNCGSTLTSIGSLTSNAGTPNHFGVEFGGWWN